MSCSFLELDNIGTCGMRRVRAESCVDGIQEYYSTRGGQCHRA